MEPLTTVRNTAVAGQEGRLIVEAGRKKKKKMLKSMILDGKGGPGFDISSSAAIAKQISDVNALSTREKILKAQVTKQVGTGKKKKVSVKNFKQRKIGKLITKSIKAPKAAGKMKASLQKMVKLSSPKFKKTKVKF